MNNYKLILIVITFTMCMMASASAIQDPSIIITSPKEGGIYYIDVVPPHITVQGIVNATNGIKNITITDGQKSFEIDFNDKTHFEFSYEFPYSFENNQITVKVEDLNGNYSSDAKRFSVSAGLPPKTQAPGFVGILCVAILIGVIILRKM